MDRLTYLNGSKDILVLHTGQKIQKSEIFHEVEPYLTFLNISQLERQGADIQSKVKELEQINNQSLRNRDQLKDDAISQLSGQLVAFQHNCRKLKDSIY